jgi:hypothetical protein
MKKFSIIPALAIGLLMVACSGTTSREELYKEVMAVHDEIMPLTGKVMQMKKSVNEKIDSLQQAGGEEYAATIGKLQQTATELDDAHEGMMQWMREFDHDFDGKVEEEIINYLQSRKDAIQTIGEQSRLAIEDAREMLAQQPE